MTSSVVGQRAAVVVAAGMLALTGCTGGSSDAGPSPTTAQSASPTKTPTAAQQLRALAGNAKDTSYRATYLVHRAKPGSRATMRVDRTPKSVRVDITTGAKTATLIATPASTFACTRSHGRRACFRVAKGDQRIPAPFNLAPASIFTSDIARLAAHPGKYDIKVAGQRQAQGDVPASTCFRTRAKTGPKPERRAITYCFSDEGVIVFARYASGNDLRLQALRSKVDPKAFRPYAKPTDLTH